MYANGKIITIDQSITVLSLNTTAGGGVAGGSFLVGVGASTITATIMAGSASCLTHGILSSITVIGNCIGSATSAVAAINITGGGVLSLTGNITGGEVSNARAVYISNASSLNVVGNVTGGNVTGAYGVYCDGNNGSSVSITGVVTGGVTGGVRQSGGSLAIHGSVSGSFGVYGFGLSIYGGPRCDIYGMAVGGSSDGICGVIRNGVTPLYCDTVRGGTAIGAVGISNAVLDSNVFVKAIDNQNSYQAAILGAFRFVPTSLYNITGYQADGITPVSYLPEPIVADHPLESDVRSGVVYSHGSFVGICAVPLPESVLIGVPVDDTIGSALTNIQAIADLNESLTTLLGKLEAGPDDQSTIYAYTYRDGVARLFVGHT